jgi:hypothetical protein
MDKIWAFKVKVPLGYQWWHVAYDAEADARDAIEKVSPGAQIIEAKRTGNVYKLEDGACYQLPNTRPPN